MMDSQQFDLFTSLRYDPILLGSAENDEVAFSRPCPFYMLIHHRDRVLEAARFFKFDAIEARLSDGPRYQAFLWTRVKEYQEQGNRDEVSPLKIRIVFSRTGEIYVQCGPVPSVELESLYPSTFALPEDEGIAKPFQPSPLTGGALSMGPDDYKPSDAIGRKVTPIKATFNIIIDVEQTKVTPHTMLKTTYRPHYDAARARAFHSAINQAGLEDKEVLLHNTAGQMMDGSVTTAYFHRGGRWVTPPVTDDHGGQRGTTRRWALATGKAQEAVVLQSSIVSGEKIWLSNGVRGFGWGIVGKTK